MLKLPDWVKEFSNMLNGDIQAAGTEHNLVVAAKVLIVSTNSKGEVDIETHDYKGTPRCGEEQLLYNAAMVQAKKVLSIERSL